MEFFVRRLEEQIIFLAVFFPDRHRGCPNFAIAYVKRLDPVIRAVFFNNKKTGKPHRNVSVGLHMAMVIHCAGLARFDDVGFALPRHHVHLGGLPYPVIPFASMVHVRMIDPVEMNGMRKIMGVLQDNPDHVALLDADRRGWHPQQ